MKSNKHKVPNSDPKESIVSGRSYRDIVRETPSSRDAWRKTDMMEGPYDDSPKETPEASEPATDDK